MIQNENVNNFLKGRLKYSPKALCEELFYKIEGQPHWNPTMLESKIVKVSICL